MYSKGDSRARAASIVALAAAVVAASLAPARADAVAEFYRGKTVTLLVGVNVGAAYDLQGRLIARFIRNHIPGNPTIVVQNMIGAGGLKMANFLHNAAPKDGTYLGMFGNTLVASQAVGAAGVEFDARGFQWVGTISPIVLTMAAWHTKGLKTIEDARAKESTAAASARGAITHTFPSMMNAFLGTRFKIVSGYQGLSDMSLAVERGEADAVTSSWSGWKTTKADWLRDKKLSIIVQTEPKTKELPGIPSVEELAKSDEDRQAIELILSATKLGFPMVATPGVPADRIAAIRNAFDATMKDPAFIAAATQMQLEIDPVQGAALQSLVTRLLQTPKSAVDRARPIISD